MVRERAIAIAAMLCAAAVSVAAAEWRVFVESSDIGARAHAIDVAGQPLIDVTAAAGDFNLSVRYTPLTVTVIDREGTEWRASAGESQLRSAYRVLDLGSPVRFDGRTLFLPASVVADLAGLEANIDRASKRIEFHAPAAAKRTPREPAPQAATTSVSNEGWQFFDLPKAKSELADQQRRTRLQQAPPFVESLPPTHENLHVQFGVGAVQGGDSANEIIAGGSIDRVQTQLYSLLTYGNAGVQFYAGHLALFDPVRHWSAEAGDLSSDVWGFARGARVAYEGTRQRPQISVYLADQRTLIRKSLASFGDEMLLTRRFSVGGEVGTDKSWLARATLRHERFGFSIYKRDVPAVPLLRGDGGSAYLNLFRGLSLQGGATRSGEGADRLTLRTGSLRVPIWRGSDITADRTETETPLRRTDVNGVSLSVPVRGMLLRTRYLELTSTPKAGSIGPQFEEHILTATIGYSLGGRGRIDFETYRPLFPAGGRSSQQIFASYRVSQNTYFEAVTSNIQAPGGFRQYRYRVDQRLSPHFAATVEYGQIPPYQSTTVFTEPPDHARFRLMLRAIADAPTPAGGGEIAGIVTDDRGAAVAGVPVRMPPYVTVTGVNGRYEFHRVPPGSYRISLDAKGIPAGFVARTGERPLQVDRGTTQEIDWGVVAATGLVRGIVYIDRNGNNQPDAGEMLTGATITIDGHFAVTGPDGWFAFYNLPPGQYVLRLDVGRLPQRVVPGGATEIQVSFPHADVMTVVFRLIEKPKETEFQKIR